MRTAQSATAAQRTLARRTRGAQWRLRRRPRRSARAALRIVRRHRAVQPGQRDDQPRGGILLGEDGDSEDHPEAAPSFMRILTADGRSRTPRTPDRQATSATRSSPGRPGALTARRLADRRLGIPRRHVRDQRPGSAERSRPGRALRTTSSRPPPAKGVRGLPRVWALIVAATTRPARAIDPQVRFGGDVTRRSDHDR